MAEIKITINNIEYDLEPVVGLWSSYLFDDNTPLIKFGGKVFCGKATPNVKEKKPLFKTEDGFDVFEDTNGHLFYVDAAFTVTSILACNFWVKSNISRSFKDENLDIIKKEGFKSDVIWFRDIKAAENYVKCNKVTLTLKDALAEWADTYDKFKSNITKVVKSKI